jgi:hypothetical protein
LPVNDRQACSHNNTPFNLDCDIYYPEDGDGPVDHNLHQVSTVFLTQPDFETITVTVTRFITNTITDAITDYAAATITESFTDMTTETFTNTITDYFTAMVTAFITKPATVFISDLFTDVATDTITNYHTETVTLSYTDTATATATDAVSSTTTQEVDVTATNTVSRITINTDMEIVTNTFSATETDYTTATFTTVETDGVTVTTTAVVTMLAPTVKRDVVEERAAGATPSALRGIHTTHLQSACTFLYFEDWVSTIYTIKTLARPTVRVYSLIRKPHILIRSIGHSYGHHTCRGTQDIHCLRSKIYYRLCDKYSPWHIDHSQDRHSHN